jgi:redox-sensitive bicupin YhaK (pirin superfamily)
MPEQEQGLLAGFQLWVNLPAAHKMDAPGYQEYPAAAIPLERRGDAIRVRVIAGVTSEGTRGPVEQPLTDPLYLDVELAPGTTFSECLPDGHNAFVFLVEGSLQLPGSAEGECQLQTDELAVLSRGVSVSAVAGVEGARFLLVAGLPLREPVARGGPFVMNTHEEIRQAEQDYAAGRF